MLPSSESLKDTVENFNIYFQEKIKAIRNNFDHVDSDDQLPSYCGEKLAEFSPTTIEELEEIIKASEIKSSSIDPLPYFVKMNSIGRYKKTREDCKLRIFKSQILNI